MSKKSKQPAPEAIVIEHANEEFETKFFKKSEWPKNAKEAFKLFLNLFLNLFS